MVKTYLKIAEENSAFLNPVPVEGEKDKKGEREDTLQLNGARLINIERIEPDPDQPRKMFDENAMVSLAESIRELGEIIDPLTVEYDDRKDIFRIISGERRFRAAIIAGLQWLPCILKDVDDKRRVLLQLIANVQRVDISPLEETEGIRTLIKRFNYSQTQAAKILNKSKSYISQVLGLERLTPPAKEIAQAAGLSKEILIQASKEKAPEKQVEILKKASSEGQTIRQLREGLSPDTQANKDVSGKHNQPVESFKKWTWLPADKGFVITIQFKEKQNTANKVRLIRSVLERTSKQIAESTDGN